MVHIVILFHTYTFAFLVFILFFIRSTRCQPVDSSKETQWFFRHGNWASSSYQTPKAKGCYPAAEATPTAPGTGTPAGKQDCRASGAVATIWAKPWTRSNSPRCFSKLKFYPKHMQKRLTCSTRSVACPSFGMSYRTYSCPNISEIPASSPIQSLLIVEKWTSSRRMLHREALWWQIFRCYQLSFFH